MLNRKVFFSLIILGVLGLFFFFPSKASACTNNNECPDDCGPNYCDGNVLKNNCQPGICVYGTCTFGIGRPRTHADDCGPCGCSVDHCVVCSTPTPGGPTPTSPPPTPEPPTPTVPPGGSCDSGCGTCGYKNNDGTCGSSNSCCHRECSGSNCVTVYGGGNNDCDNDSQCSPGPTNTPTPTQAPNRISGNVYNDPGGSCATTRVSGSPWDTARMKLDGSREDLLGDGYYQFDSVTGGGHGLWIYRNASQLGLPNGWTCSSCVTGNTCSGTSSAAAGNTYNFFVKQGDLAWFQTRGGDDHAQGNISSSIPSTAQNKNFSQDLNSYPGVVSYGGSLSLGQGQVSSKGWSADTGFDLSRYNYSYFYQKLGSPTTAFNCASPTTTSGFYRVGGDCVLSGGSRLNFGSNKLVVFVDGNLKIEREIGVGSSGFVAFIVRNNIEVSSTVGNNRASANRDDVNIQGFYLADGTFDTNKGDTDAHDRLVGQGVLKAQRFVLERDLGVGANYNSKYSAELFIFDPNLVLNAPEELWGSSMSWLEVAP